MAEDNSNKIAIKGFNKFSKEFIGDIASELARLDKKATGKLIDSLSWEVKDFISQIKIDFFYEDYGKWVELGRKPGKFPPISKIKEWCKTKGIEEKAAYPISYKIYKFGIKPTPFVSDIIKNKNVDDSLGTLTTQHFGEQLQFKLDKLVEDINKQK